MTDYASILSITFLNSFLGPDDRHNKKNACLVYFVPTLLAYHYSQPHDPSL